MFEQILAYTFIALFSGVVLFGHVMLVRDIFSAGPSSSSSTGIPDRPSDTTASDRTMRKAA
jgi:hypothetical protein